MKRVAIPVAMAAMALAASCSSGNGGEVDVTVVASACVDQGKTCFMLPIPQADVELKDSSGKTLATGKTDAAGRITLSTSFNGQIHITAKSALLKGGQAQGSVNLSNGGSADSTVAAALSEEAKPGT